MHQFQNSKMSFLLRLPCNRVPGLLGRSRVFRLVGQPPSREISSAFSGDLYYRRRFSAKERGRFSPDFRITDPTPININFMFRIVPDISGCCLNVRLLHSTGPSGEKSKIEETVKRLEYEFLHCHKYKGSYKINMKLIKIT